MGRYILPFLVVLLAVGCSGGLLTPDATGTDQFNDVLRDGEFAFESFVTLSITITPDLPGSTARSLSTSAVVIQGLDEDGRVLFSGLSRDGEAVSGDILIPSSAESMTVTLDGEEIESRTMVIEEPAQYAVVDRTLALKTGDKGSPGGDRDGDGVPDAYDAFPDNYRLAFTRTIPADNELTVAFEDNYPELGDGDYNDFIACYAVTEFRDANNALVRMDGRVQALARGAGYDHEFGIVVRFAGYSGTTGVIVYDSDGSIVETRSDQSTDLARIVIFPDTKAVFDRPGGVTSDNVVDGGTPSYGYTAEFTLEIDGTLDTSKEQSGWAPFDPYLLIDSDPELPNYDVHLIGQSPLPGSLNPEGLDGTVDEAGYPRALLVPHDWEWPVERTHIEDVYPNFADWCAASGMAYSDWYLFPTETGTVTR